MALSSPGKLAKVRPAAVLLNLHLLHNGFRDATNCNFADVGSA